MWSYRPSYLRTFLYECGNVEGEVLDRLIELHVVLPGGGRPDAVVVLLQPSQPPHPGRRVGAPPVRAQALLPQIPQGVLPMVVQAGEPLLQMRVVHGAALVSPLWQAALRVGCTVGMVEEMHQRPEKAAAAVHTTCLVTVPCRHGLLCLHRYIAGLLAEAPTQGPSLLSQSQACLMLLGFPLALTLRREERRACLRCPQLCLTVWQGSACKRACG